MKVTTIAMGIGLSAFLMTGCGGDPQKENPQNTPQTPSAKHTATLSGVAVDDLILNGKVSAEKSDGSVLTTGRTSATDGSYTLKVDYSGVVVVSVTCDSTSKMLDPVTHEKKACNGVDGLKSIASVERDKEAKVNITPLTHIVYERAKALVGDDFNASTIEAANEDIKKLFNVDPLGDNPIEGNYAKVTEAFSDVAEKNPDKDFMDVVKDTADGLKDGKADGSEAVKEVADEMKNNGASNPIVATDGDYTPPSNEDNGKSDLENAKELFGNLLAAYSVKGDPKGKVVKLLEEKAQAFKQDHDAYLLFRHFLMGRDHTFTTVLEAYADKVAQGEDEAVRQIYAGQKEVERTDENNNTYSDYVDVNRTVTVTATTTGAHYTISGIDTNETKFSGDITFNQNDGAFNIQNIFEVGKATYSLSGDIPADVYDENSTAITITNLKAVLTASQTSTDHMLVAIDLSGKVSTGADELNVKKITGSIAYHKDENNKVFGDYLKLGQIKGTAKAAGMEAAVEVKAESYQQVKSLKDKGFSYSVTEGEGNYTWKRHYFANSGWFPKTISVDGNVTSTDSAYLKMAALVDLSAMADLNITSFDHLTKTDLKKVRATFSNSVALKLPDVDTPIVLSGSTVNASTGLQSVYAYLSSDVSADINNTIVVGEHNETTGGYPISIDTNLTDTHGISVVTHVDSEMKRDESGSKNIGVIKGKNNTQLGAIVEPDDTHYPVVKFTDGTTVEIK